MRNDQAFEKISQIFKDSDITFHVIHHPPCRTSAESAQARGKAGFPEAVGAKALLIKATFMDNHDEYIVLVLPGTSKLSSQIIKQELNDLKKFRFATADELLEVCGVVPGAMPPFGKLVFPNISKLYVDKSIGTVQTLGFNAADLECSIIVQSKDYLTVCGFDKIMNFAIND